MEIQNAIDKLLTLKESFSKIANSYSSLVPKEFVTIQLHAENTDLSAYKIKVVNTTSGNEEFYDISASGYTEFEIKYDSVYEIVFPIIGAYITPATRTFTAQKPMRKIEASYVMAGVFGLDEQGNRYSLEHIEALEDKSIIKYGGYTEGILENYQKADGTYGCGFMWEIGNEKTPTALKWAEQSIEFSQELLPFIMSTNDALPYCDGETYTNYIISEAVRLGTTSPIAEWCLSQTIIINGCVLNGFLISFGQIFRLFQNKTVFENLYTILGRSPMNTMDTYWTSHQSNAGNAVRIAEWKYYTRPKSYALHAFRVFPLPK